MTVRAISFRARAASVGALFAASCVFSPAFGQNNIFDAPVMAPFVPTPELVVSHMLETAKLTPEDKLYDLGSGDGRILFAAAEEYGASAVGIEISEVLVTKTRERAEQLGLAEKVEVRRQNLLEADLSDATVVTVYLLSSSNEQLRPKLEKELKPGTRVISHDFQFEGWTPKQTVEVDGGGRPHHIYLYEIAAGE